jgi:hypothetical protein
VTYSPHQDTDGAGPVHRNGNEKCIPPELARAQNDALRSQYFHGSVAQCTFSCERALDDPEDFGDEEELVHRQDVSPDDSSDDDRYSGGRVVAGRELEWRSTFSRGKSLKLPALCSTRRSARGDGEAVASDPRGEAAPGSRLRWRRRSRGRARDGKRSTESTGLSVPFSFHGQCENDG